MNKQTELENKFYEKINEFTAIPESWKIQLAHDLAEIAYKQSDERVKELKEMYDGMGKLYRESNKEITKLEKQLAITKEKIIDRLREIPIVKKEIDRLGRAGYNGTTSPCCATLAYLKIIKGFEQIASEILGGKEF